MYVEKAYSTVEAIGLSDRDVKPGGSLGTFREEQAMRTLYRYSSHT